MDSLDHTMGGHRQHVSRVLERWIEIKDKVEKKTHRQNNNKKKVEKEEKKEAKKDGRTKR